MGEFFNNGRGHIVLLKKQIILALLSHSLPAVPQIRGHIAGPPPPSPLRYRALIFIARIIQHFLPSSTRVELHQVYLVLGIWIPFQMSYPAYLTNQTTVSTRWLKSPSIPLARKWKACAAMPPSMIQLLWCYIHKYSIKYSSFRSMYHTTTNYED